MDSSSGNPFNKRRKVPSGDNSIEVESSELTTIIKQRISSPTASSSTLSAGSFVTTRTPKKLPLVQSDVYSVQSLPPNSSSLQAPSLQPPDLSSRGRENRTYSQSPPRSPGRSPTRKLELIQLSPVKKNRLELQKIHDSLQLQTQNKTGRLCINKLVLNDFKSYAGQQVVGPFHSSFSAVVGPNGSGKSNVIDSMLFVFGFRASKMRQDRLSDLIHNSETHSNLPSCSVEVHFHYVIDEDDGHTRINEDKSELIITRKAFRNNSSKYYINGCESNYTEVTRLLKTEGIDLDHKRFLILQGEVENIAQMKPKAEKEGDDGLLEYLEDIIGTSQYKGLIETNITEIEALNEICIEKENRFHIVNNEKQSLESDKEAALEFLDKEKQLTLLTSKLLQYNILQNNAKLSNTLKKHGEMKDQLKNEAEKCSASIKEMDTIKNESKSISETLKTCEIEEKDLLSKKRSLDGERISNEEKIKNLSQKKRKAEQILDSTNKSLNESKNNLQDLLEDQQQNEKDLSDLTEELHIERAKLEDLKLSLKDKTVDISFKISEYEKELEPWTEKVEAKKAQIQLAESEIALMKDSRTKLKIEMDDLKQEIDKNNEEQVIRKQDIEKLRQEKQMMARNISSGDDECCSARDRLKEMQTVLFSQRQRVVEARAALSTAENKSKVLTALTKLQKSGRISGFHGRLGDLGVIDKKYDIAISTACPRLEDIVVDSVECGQQCIEYLRKNKLGYARFILLDKLRKLNTNPINTPEQVPRLFDLIKPKSNQFIPAFYSVLRDTLVSKDLAQANRVAYGKRKYRVVSLDGKLIDLSGTMSGGGKQVARGLMQLEQKQTEISEIYTQEEVEKLEDALAGRETNFNIASDTFRQMEEELKTLHAREPEIELSISQLMMDIDSWDNESQFKNDQLSERKQAYDGLILGNDDYVQAEVRLKSLKQERKSLEDQTRSKTTNIKLLKEEIMKIGGSELQIQNSKVTSIQQRIEIISAKQKKGKSAIKKTENEIKKCLKNLENMKKDLDSYIQQSNKLEEKIQVTVDKLNSIQECIEKLSNQQIDLNENLQLISSQLSEKEESLANFRSLKIELDDKIEKLDSLASHIKREITKSENEIEKLGIRDISRTLQLLDEQEAKKQSDVGPKSDGCDIPDEMTNSPNEKEGDELQDGEPMSIDERYETMENGLPRIPEKELQDVNIESLEAEIGQLKDYIDNSSADIEVLEEYARRLAEYRIRKLDLNEAVEKRDDMRRKLDDLKKKRFEEFMRGFGIISMTLKEMYQMITMGGNAELELVDSLDPFSEGVTFSVMPPKKSWRNITNLSGGEKTLSSLALVFALHKYKPTPLYVMDEIDAALDFRNVSIVANYIKQRTKNAQFIVISLRNNMFELAQQLVGIYKRENMTKSATLKNVNILRSSA